MKRIILLLVLTVSMSAMASSVYNVKDYGAKGDGKALDHIAINKAIEAAAQQGGGQVLLPQGVYLCGSIRLKSHIDLHLMPGAKILAAPAEMKVYDESEVFGAPEYQDGGHTYFHNSLIWAEGQQDISISGYGVIDGEGLTRHDTERAGNVQGGSIGTGDKAIALKQCRNITIRDITIFRGGHFAIIITGCDIGTIDNVTIDTNRDGIDIDCCKYITVS
ncbi:MAG: exo-poly-alpha-D-galacturonosidase, partial [Prevotella sp.]|nr:exo-poly-alpha-D-galacturonosidase [Prevotella sp.]